MTEYARQWCWNICRCNTDILLRFYQDSQVWAILDSMKHDWIIWTALDLMVINVFGNIFRITGLIIFTDKNVNLLTPDYRDRQPLNSTWCMNLTMKYFMVISCSMLLFGYGSANLQIYEYTYSEKIMFLPKHVQMDRSSYVRVQICEVRLCVIS